MKKSYFTKMPKRFRSERAVQEAKKRKDDYEAKRFNAPLNIFIKRRYPEIYSEYVKFFNFIEFTNPGKKNLLKTKTFKKWLEDNPEPPVNLTLSASKIPLVNSKIPPAETITASANHSETPPSVNKIPLVETITASANHSETPLSASKSSLVNSEIPSLNCEMTTTAFANRSETPPSASMNSETIIASQSISDILDNLFGPDGIPDDVFLSEDEGVDLNRFEEISFDYEPFDFLNEAFDL